MRIVGTGTERNGVSCRCGLCRARADQIRRVDAGKKRVKQTRRNRLGSDRTRDVDLNGQGSRTRNSRPRPTPYASLGRFVKSLFAVYSIPPKHVEPPVRLRSRSAQSAFLCRQPNINPILFFNRILQN